MTIGIIGAGALGTGVARVFAAAGVAAVISNSRGPDSLAGLVEELGQSIKAGTTEEAAQADIVVVAVRWEDVGRVIGGLPAWSGRIVIDTTNPVTFLEPGSPEDPTNPLAAYGIKPIDLGGRHSSAVFSEHVPGARVVKLFNHLDARTLAPASPVGGQTVLFYSGDDADAKAQVRALVETLGFYPIDLGALDVGGPLASLPFGPLAASHLVKI
ncbi:NADPH-dependent F420 reductase [Sphingobium chlorophenolicum]|uniref:NADP oxidoreductase, coenzyme F420-dependent protein n=1 Tax=Sphingobium chlorophenolicum TaxID=46429 RepID=A0A081RFB8_SPHCR|nr:NAD(P)-binding domain-containing protein [Sphingobium chlorophenolicum]KEQ53891.1 NADP oxidoreductase, coenzyme F420-dependent protein [Sphingobium chlorophenolicum]